MQTNALIGIVVIVVVLALGGWVLFSGDVPTPASVSETSGGSENLEPSDTSEEPVVDPEFHALITYTDAGYAPSTITIARGQTVRFVNNASADTWPASAVHPTHSIYPGSGIQKCNTAEQAGIFDACRGLNPGEFWEFTFTEAGEWRYHNHLRASDTGVIIVTL